MVDTDLYGVNGEWKATDAFTLTADLYRSTSKRYSGGQDTYVVLRMNQPNTARISLRRAAVPNVSVQLRRWPRAARAAWPTDEFSGSDFNTHYMELRGDNIDDKITGGIGRRQAVRRASGPLDDAAIRRDPTDRRRRATWSTTR